ncbi:MAG: tripartite tricarboxylate transporter permease [Candidatus Aenigmarchaeota archaeon]|nr:tripartite tricarboxylate transporter permease [Candidatus Aenigmarchaeota archaeon]
MVFEILLFVLLGIGVGIFAGLCPGMHPNTLFFIVLALSSFIPVSSYSLIAFIITVSIMDLMANYIPNIFLSVPDTDLVINVLPGHRLVLKGKGHDALFISLLGAYGTLVLCLILLPLLIYIIPFLHNFVYPYIHILLLVTTGWMCLVEKGIKKKMLCALMYVLSGVWGILCLNSPAIKSQDVLFPALIGMFGVSSLILSLKEKVKLPEQRLSKEIKIGKTWKIVSVGLIAGLLTGILPGIGQSQAAVMVSTFGRMSEKEFLGSLSGINMSNLVFSIISLYSFGKIRSGAAAAIDEISDFGFNELLFSACIMLLSSSLAVLITWFMGKNLLKYLQKVNYTLISKVVVVLIIGMVFWFTGFIGLFILFISTCMGILPALLGIKRTSNMGFLMVSTMFYFAGLGGATSQFIIA